MTASRKAPKDLLASEVERREVRWLWRGRIPEGMPTLVAGRAGTAKSLFTAQLAAEVSQKADVIFSNREDPLNEVVVPRLEAAGANMKRISFMPPSFILPRDTLLLGQMVERRKAKLIVLDPIAAHLSVSIFNDQQVRLALTPLAQMLAELGCACVMVAHTVKYVSRGAHPLTAVGGPGGGVTGASRAVFLFGEDPHDQDVRVLAAVKFNLGRKPKAVAWEIEEYEFYDDDDRLTGTTGRLVLVDDQRDINPISLVTPQTGVTQVGKGSEKREEAAEWLTNYLSLGPRPMKDVREDAARVMITYATLRRAYEDVEIESFRKGFGKGGQNFWRLPDGHPNLLVSNSGEEEEDDASADSSV